MRERENSNPRPFGTRSLAGAACLFGFALRFGSNAHKHEARARELQPRDLSAHIHLLGDVLVGFAC